MGWSTKKKTGIGKEENKLIKCKEGLIKLEKNGRRTESKRATKERSIRGAKKKIEIDSQIKPKKKVATTSIIIKEKRRGRKKKKRRINKKKTKTLGIRKTEETVVRAKKPLKATEIAKIKPYYSELPKIARLVR